MREVKGNALVIPRDAVKVKEKLCDGVGGPVHRGKYKEKSVCVKVRHYRCHVRLMLVLLMLDSGVQSLLWTWGAVGRTRHSLSGGQLRRACGCCGCHHAVSLPPIVAHVLH